MKQNELIGFIFVCLSVCIVQPWGFNIMRRGDAPTW
jgi:hypothetical protein